MTVLNVDTRVETMRIVRHLDAGLLGDVYEVYDEGSRETFALKVIKREFVDELHFSDHFERECQVISQLENDAVLDLGLFGATKWKHWLRYEFFERFEMEDNSVRTLLDYLQVKPTGLDEVEVAFLTGQILQALVQAHSMGLLHRNLKPSNVLIRRPEEEPLEVKISDFGLVRLVGEARFRELWDLSFPDEVNYTLLQSKPSEENSEAQAFLPALETKMFRTPEERSGAEVEESSDLYAVACMAHWALTGEPLTENGKLRLSAGLNPGWRTWLMRGTAENPSERFADAKDALKQLPRPGTSLRYAEMPFEREGQHRDDRTSPYMEGEERSTEGAESNLKGTDQGKPSWRPWAIFSAVSVVICLSLFGLWQLYRTGYHSPSTIYKSTASDDYYKLKFGFYQGGAEWKGFPTGKKMKDKRQRIKGNDKGGRDQPRHGTGEWTTTDDGHYVVRIKMRFQTLPDDDGETPKKDRALAAMAGKGNDDLYITWQDVLSYDPEEDRFKWVKRIQDGIEYFPGREEGDASKLGLFVAKRFDSNPETTGKPVPRVVKADIYFEPFDRN
jgi:serine/threonine protein kinase